MEDGVDLLACVCSHIIASEEHQPRSSGRLSEEDQTHVVMQRSRGVRTRAQRRVHEEQKPEGGGSREQEPRRAQGNDVAPRRPDELIPPLEYSDDSISETSSVSDSDGSFSPDQTILQLLDDQIEDHESDSCSSIDSHTMKTRAKGRKVVKLEAGEANSTEGVVVSACLKRDGGRVYDKRHYCVYCSKPYAKMARHLESSHANEADVATALNFPKGSRDRRKQLDFIRKRGNYAHNAAVMETGKGELVPTKRPPADAHGDDFMHCAYCQGLYTRKVLWRHMRNCKLKPDSSTAKLGKNRVQSLCTFTGPMPSNMSRALWAVVSAMNPGPITEVIRRDKLIVKLGQHLLNKGGLSAPNKQYVRDKMREMARLVITARSITSIKTTLDCVNPRKYSEVIKAVKVTCGYDSDSERFTLPTLVTKLGNTLVKVAKLLKNQGLVSNNVQIVKITSEFLELHERKWNEMISLSALKNSVKEEKWERPDLLVFVEDVQKIHSYLQRANQEWYQMLSENPTAKTWTELAKITLAQTILLNQGREGAVSSMPLSAYLSRNAFDVDWTMLSEVEKNFCRRYERFTTRGKCGRPVPVLLTASLTAALNLLVQHRETCGVSNDNVYMFARPAAASHFRGSDCLRAFAKQCGAKFPEALTSARLRKQAGNISMVLNMTDEELKELENFLVYYEKMETSGQQRIEHLAKISKLLLALEEGRLVEFHRLNWTEISINPAEKVALCDRRSLQNRRSSSTANGKRGQQKRPWLPLEVAAVERHMSGFISSLTVPAKNDCDLCLQAEPQALSRRDWRNVKFYIHNRILALKRNLRSPEQSLHSQFELGPNQSSQSELADHQNFQTKHLMMESFQHHLSSELF